MSTKDLTDLSLEEAQKLYDVASRVRALAPWQWMEESQIFGVKNPETEELGFVSVMGMGGEHFAIAVYRGAEGLYGFWAIEEAGPYLAPQILLEIPQLQASFEERSALQKPDRDLLKKLHLKFRGAKAWPLFRSYGSGYLPWYLTAEEARFLACALEQTLAVAPRVRDNPDLLRGDEAGSHYLVRVAQREQGCLIWGDEVMQVPEPAPAQVPVAVDANALQQVKSFPPGRFALEVDFFSLPTPVQENGGRPYFPYMLMLVESHSGAVLGSELMPHADTKEQLWGQIPMGVVRKLAEVGTLPDEIRVASELLDSLLQPLGQELPCPIKQVAHLPSLDVAKDGMFHGSAAW